MSKIKFRTAYGEKNKVVVETKDALTEQCHKDECDIGRIIATYDKTGVLTSVNKFESQYGDLTGIEYQDMLVKVSAANSAFENLPSHVRNEFANDPANFLAFMDNLDANYDQAVELGLAKAKVEITTDRGDGGVAAVEASTEADTGASA